MHLCFSLKTVNTNAYKTYKCKNGLESASQSDPPPIRAGLS